MKAPFLLYGSNGYTGSIIARLAKDLGIPLQLAGRNAQALQEQSEALGFPYMAFSLHDTPRLHQALESCAGVIHCAGPFAHTAMPMAEACLATSRHYLDITGEYRVFEALASLHSQALEKQIMLMPGVGFDVVPSDCLAVYLHDLMPEAEKLELAFMGLNGGVSRGTAKTMVHHLGEGTMVRQDGKLVQKPADYRIEEIAFGETTQLSACISWGDISTAWHSTGIPNIEVLMAVTPAMARQIRMSKYLGPMLRSTWFRNFLLRKIDKNKPGPSESRRARASSLLWGRVTHPNGTRKEALLSTPDGYTLTAHTALLIAQRIGKNQAPAGFQTPAKAYGPDLILEAPNTHRTLLHP
jgi:short subunit dehydrogenase-like uncharacterized protein